MTDRLLSASTSLPNLVRTYGQNNGIKKRTIGFLGESNADRAAKLGHGSWLFWAQALKPRNVYFDPAIHNCAVSGSKSGAGYAFSAGVFGAVTTAAVDGTDMNTPIIRAKALAAGVDDWFFSPNGNDGTNAESSYRNNREMVDYLRANGGGKRFIFWSCISPKIVPNAPQAFTPQLHALMHAWKETTDDVFFYDLTHLLVDDATGFSPRSYASNYSLLADSIGHVAPAGAIAIAKEMNPNLDLLGGFPNATIHNTNTLDKWSSTLTGANAFQGPGFTGSGGFAGANTTWTGSIPSSVQVLTDNAELTCAAQVVTNGSVKGQPKNALRLTLTAAGNFTSNRTLSVKVGAGGSVTVTPNTNATRSKTRVQLVVQTNALVDCAGMALKVVSTGGTNPTLTFGAQDLGNGAVGAAAAGNTLAISPSLTETLFFVPMTQIDLSASTSASFTFQIVWPVGTLAGALGSVDLMMDGWWADPVLPTYP